MVRAIILVSVVWAAACAAGCEQDWLFEPCARNEQCEDFFGQGMRCVVSPFHGESSGFCTIDCESRQPDLEPGQCVPDSRCSDGMTEGCCHINYVEGYRGAGFCVPFAPPGGGADAQDQ